MFGKNQNLHHKNIPFSPPQCVKKSEQVKQNKTKQQQQQKTNKQLQGVLLIWFIFVEFNLAVSYTGLTSETD